MEGIDQQFQKDLKKAERNAELNEKGENRKGFRDDIDEEDDEESYYRYGILIATFPCQFL